MNKSSNEANRGWRPPVRRESEMLVCLFYGILFITNVQSITTTLPFRIKEKFYLILVKYLAFFIRKFLAFLLFNGPTLPGKTPQTKQIIAYRKYFAYCYEG